MPRGFKSFEIYMAVASPLNGGIGGHDDLLYLVVVQTGKQLLYAYSVGTPPSMEMTPWST